MVTKTTDDNRTTNGGDSTPRAVIPTPARRITSEDLSETSDSSDDDNEHSITYNEHEKPNPNTFSKPPAALAAVVASVPIAKPDEDVARRRAEEIESGLRASDDINPIPPTVKSDAANENPPGYTRKPIVESDSEGRSDSNDVTDSEEEKPATNVRNPPTTTTTNVRGAPATTTTTNVRGAPTTTTTTAPTTASRLPAATTTTSTAPITTTNDRTRTGAGPSANPNRK